MKNLNKEGIKSEQGFTMIELIIVVAIMGILAAILVPSFTQMTRKSRFNADLNTIKNVQTQIELYMAEHDGEFPSSDQKAPTAIDAALEGTNSIVTILVDQQYLKSTDVDSTGLLDLQSRNDGVVAVYNGTTGIENAALNVTGDKLEKIVKGVSDRDNKWVLFKGAQVEKKGKTPTETDNN